MNGDYENKFGICAGRWQPWHYGHDWHFRYTLDNFKNIVLVIVNPDPLNPTAPSSEWGPFSYEMNPMNYWERYVILWNYMKHLKVLDRVDFSLAWHPSKSLKREEFYLPSKVRRVWTLPLVQEHDVGKKLDLEKKGEKVLSINISDTGYQYEAMRIRKLILEKNQQWRECTPPFIAEEMEKLNVINRIESRNEVANYDSKDYNVYVSYFQPFDIIDEINIKTLVADNRSLVIGIADAEFEGCGNNVYFNYWERLQHIKHFLINHNILNLVMIVPIMNQNVAVFLPNNFHVYMREDFYSFDFLNSLDISYDKISFLEQKMQFTINDLHRRVENKEKIDSFIPVCLQTDINVALKLKIFKTSGMKGDIRMKSSKLIDYEAELVSIENAISILEQQREEGTNLQDYMLLRTTYDKKRIKVINQLQEYVNENIDDKDEIISALEMLKASEKTDKIIKLLDNTGVSKKWHQKFLDLVKKNKDDIVSIVIKVIKEAANITE